MDTTIQISTLVKEEINPLASRITHLDQIFPVRRRKLKFYNQNIYKHLKDACPVFDGEKWHLFGTADKMKKGGWIEVIHAIALVLDGPWLVLDPVKLEGLTGPHPCAPGVIYDPKEKAFYMYIHTDFLKHGGTIECLKSVDFGKSFQYISNVVQSLPNNGECRIYDPHPTEINDEKYVIYTSVNEDDLFTFRLVRSINNRWDDTMWERLGEVMSEHEVTFQNQPKALGREWGIEGAQLIQLPNNKILMNAVCFLPETPNTPPGKKQRFFLAIADNITGPYKVLAPVLEPKLRGWEAGENGHATGVIHNNELKFFYHARNTKGANPLWNFGMASIPIQSVLEYCS